MRDTKEFFSAKQHVRQKSPPSSLLRIRRFAAVLNKKNYYHISNAHTEARDKENIILLIEMSAERDCVGGSRDLLQ